MNPVALLLYASLTVLPSGGTAVSEAWEAYLAGNFQLVEQIAVTASQDTSLLDFELAWIYLALGSSRAMQGKDKPAREAFDRALQYDLLADLTSADLPPPVWRIFEPLRARQIAMQEEPPPRVDIAIAKPILPPDTVVIFRDYTPDRTTVLKSLAFPGWGHLDTGRKRGLYYMSAETALLVGFIYSTLQASTAREDYLSARDRITIDSRYRDYNTWYRLSWGTGLAAAATYIFAQYDLHIIR